MQGIKSKKTQRLKYSHLKNKCVNVNNCIGKLFLSLAFIFLFEGIGNSQTTVNYTYDGSNFPNPERGFYKYSQYPGTIGDLANYRSQGYSLIYRIYYIDRSAPLSAAFLNTFNSEMQTIRNGGVKVVLRFAYTSADNNDAPLSRVLEHLTQLQPYLQSNYDVIAILQAGFIGRWGEWYYTANFGDAGNISAADWNNRTSVLLKELEVMPLDRMVGIRYPWQKKIMLNRTATITAAEAFNGSNWSRVGFYNDGFMAAWDDWGTFPGGQADRDFLTAESVYLPSGGEAETGDLTLNGCANTTTQMTNFHFSYLDRDYNLNTINKWISEGCYTTFEKKMGYRFYLTNGTYTNLVKPGNTFNVNINITNEGFAAPFNPRLVELVLKNKADGKICKTGLTIDPRKWLPGSINLNQNIGIPANYPAGTYDVYLNLPDPTSSLYGNSAYSIRLANTGVWDATTGYNDLGFDLVISNSATGTAYSGSQWFDACYGSNSAPTATITSPANNATFITGSNITFNATATDSDGSIAKVEFYNGSTKIGEDLTGPYSFTWNGVANGAYDITARAIDNLGAIGNSSIVRVNVNSTGNAPPTVSITNPTNGQNFTPGSNITIDATALDADGTITKVEFFAGATKIGEDLTGPFSFVWSSVPAGSYTLTARATDNGNEFTISTGVNITVSAIIMCSSTGNITREVWTGIPGKLVSAVDWNSTPNSSGLITSFEGPSNVADNYGSRIHGYICPPATGNYIFYIASDDNSELWLSTDNNTSNKVKIAYVNDWTNSREWTKYPEQKSVTISLIANRKYYIEALHKDEEFGDNVAVGWTIPGSSTIDVIPSANIAPFDIALPVQIISFTGSIVENSVKLEWATEMEKDNDYFLVQRSTDGIVFENLGKINGSTRSETVLNYNFIDSEPIEGQIYYRLIQVDIDGRLSVSSIIQLSKSVAETPFNIFPNPNTGKMHLRISLEENANFRILMYDSYGSEIYSEEGILQEKGEVKGLDVSYLNPGVYSVYVISDSYVWTDRLIIAKE